MTIARAMHGRLIKAGYVVTYPRQVILSVLGRQVGPFTADELVRAVGQEHPRVGRATVFRTLSLLEELGMVERIHRAGDGSRYLVCPQTTHHHHLICVACGAVSTVNGCELEEWLRTVADPLGFQVEGHVLDVFGRCRRCRSTLVGAALPEGTLSQ